jgi:hypothetical protein
MSDGSTSITELLESRGREGSYVDSAGFTIDQLKAREKMSRYQLSDSGLWLVKLIQTAVTAGADGVDISLGRRKVRASFTPDREWDAQALLETLLTDDEPGDGSLSHLKVGLLGASGGLSQTLCWTVGHSSVELGPSGTRVSEVAPRKEFVLEATRPSRGIAWSSILTTPIGVILRQTLDEWAAVWGRCWVSPIPVRVDRRQGRQGYDVFPGIRLHERVPRRVTGLYRCLGSRTLAGPADRPLLPMPMSPVEASSETELSASSFRDPWGTFLRWRPPGIEVRGMLSLHASPLVGPTVMFVCDGVVVECRLIEPMLERMRQTSWATRPLLMPCYVFAVSPSELDLSGFAVRGLDHLELIRSCLPESLALVDQVERYLGHYRARAADEMAMIKHGIKFLYEMYDCLK